MNFSTLFKNYAILLNEIFFFIKKHSRIDKIGYLYKKIQDDSFCCL